MTLNPTPPRCRSRMPARIPSRGERTIVQRAKAPRPSLLDEQLFDNLTRRLATAHIDGRGLPQKPIRQGPTPDSLLVNRCRQQPTCVTYHAYHAYHAPFPSAGEFLVLPSILAPRRSARPARFRRPVPSCSCCHLCRSLAFWIPSPSYAGVASFAQALILRNRLR